MKISTAINIMLTQVALVSVFHLLILVKIIPYDITWGGRLQNDQQMYVFEVMSLLLNAVLGLALLIKGQRIKAIVSIKFTNIILWAFMILFALNTVGNIMAKTNFEKSFSVITLLSTIFIAVILKKGK